MSSLYQEKKPEQISCLEQLSHSEINFFFQSEIEGTEKTRLGPGTVHKGKLYNELVVMANDDDGDGTF